ncbi:MAG: 2-amino-4-hydroxy-6-hydroxymethyldihydropteridine diphosphokinase [Rhodothalassiaceae bacterium]
MNKTNSPLWQQPPEPPDSDGGVFIGLGSNLPHRGQSPEAVMRTAIAACRDAGLALGAVSSLYRSKAEGGPMQPDYLNAVIEVATTLAPGDLLALLHDIEARMGRERLVRYGPRTLDLDLLDMRGAVLPDPARWQAETARESAPLFLVLPHPRLHLRRFALAPLLEIAPDWRHPVLGVQGADLLASLPEQGIARLAIPLLDASNLAP